MTIELVNTPKNQPLRSLWTNLTGLFPISKLLKQKDYEFWRATGKLWICSKRKKTRSSSRLLWDCDTCACCSTIETLVAATKLGGQLMGLPLGVIKESWLADLLLVNGDSIEDIRILQDRDRLLMILRYGVFHRRSRSVEI